MQRKQPQTAVLSRNPCCCYIADDDGTDACDRSLDVTEAVFLRDHCRPRWGFVNGYPVKDPSVVSSPRFFGRTRYYEDEVEEALRREPHFLDSCFLCEKPLKNNNDEIFMYRGDTPFCSKECRQELIESDQQMESNMNLSSSMRSLRNKEEQQQQEERCNSPDRRLRMGAVTVA